jgi:cobalt-precorrin 5A hydrolase
MLVPKIVVAGIGCKKNTEKSKIEFAIKTCLSEENIVFSSLALVASIDLKKDEKGIADFCESNDIPFVTYSAEELKSVEGDFTKSDFVESVTGVSNVCERSAVRASGGRLICKKKVYDGVTVALAIMKGCASFE